MTRAEQICLIIDLHNFFIDEWNKRDGSFKMTKDPHFTRDWFATKPERFYLVETTTHNEEDFTASVEVRYALRSKEAYAYGDGHQAFHKRYLRTTTVEVKDLVNVEAYKRSIQDELKKA